ncbi:MAG: hypothetical protein ABIP03_07450 [Aquihabitans sp.]
MLVDGWLFSKAKGERPLASSDGPRVEVGKLYLLPLLKYRNGEWGTLGAGAVLPLEDSQIVLGERSSQHLKKYDGWTVAQVSAELKVITPDPLLEKYRSYDPITRLRLAAAERDGKVSQPDVPTTDWDNPVDPAVGESSPG